MSMRIMGIGVIGGFGCGIKSLEEALIKRYLPDADPAKSFSGPETIREPGPKLVTDTSLLARFAPPKALRRVDHYSRMAILAAYLALQEAIESAHDLSAPMGVIVATGMGPTADTLGSQALDADAADLRLSPIQFSNSVHNAAAAHIAMLLKIRGPNVSINQYDMSVPLAFQTAMDWLCEGRAGSVLVGGVDCFSKSLHETSLKSQVEDSGSRPWPVGEGSAFFVLTRTGGTESRYPSIQNIRIGSPRDVALPTDALWIHSSCGKKAARMGQPGCQADFSSIYGVFPSDMALDLAASALLLKKGPHGSTLLRNCIFGQDAMTPRICCLKTGVAGNFAQIDMA
jgi:3-oxoacyl-[acyl-carrier-protein] synthase II